MKYENILMEDRSNVARVLHEDLLGNKKKLILRNDIMLDHLGAYGKELERTKRHIRSTLACPMLIASLSPRWTRR